MFWDNMLGGKIIGCFRFDDYTKINTENYDKSSLEEYIHAR